VKSKKVLGLKASGPSIRVDQCGCTPHSRPGQIAGSADYPQWRAPQTQAAQAKVSGSELSLAGANVADPPHLRSQRRLPRRNRYSSSPALLTLAAFEDPKNRFVVKWIRILPLPPWFKLQFGLGAVRRVQFTEPRTLPRPRQKCLLFSGPFRGVKQSRDRIPSGSVSVGKRPKDSRAASATIGGQIGNQRKSCFQTLSAGGTWVDSFVGCARMRSIQKPSRSGWSKARHVGRATQPSRADVRSLPSFGFDTSRSPGATVLGTRGCPTALRLHSGSQNEGSGNAAIG